MNTNLAIGLIRLLPEHAYRLAIDSVIHSQAAFEAARESTEEGIEPLAHLSDLDIQALMKIFKFKGTIEEFKSARYELSDMEKLQLKRIADHEKSEKEGMLRHREHTEAKPTPIVGPPLPFRVFFGELKKNMY